MVAAALRDARDPWWVIGSAAVRLHGEPCTVADVDILLSTADADRLARRLNLVGADEEEHMLFRSQPFLAWTLPPLAVEFMGDLHVRAADGWCPVRPSTRERVAIGEDAVFVPDRDTMIALLQTFGRPKDRARAALLAP